MAAASFPAELYNAMDVILHAHINDTLEFPAPACKTLAQTTKDFYLTLFCRSIRLNSGTATDFDKVQPESAFQRDSVIRMPYTDGTVNEKKFGVVCAKDVARVMVRPQSALCCVLRCALPNTTDNDDTLVNNNLTDFIKLHFEVIHWKSLDSNQSNSAFFTVVKTEKGAIDAAEAFLSEGGSMAELPGYMRRVIALRMAAREKSLKARSRTSKKTKTAENDGEVDNEAAEVAKPAEETIQHVHPVLIKTRPPWSGSGKSARLSRQPSRRCPAKRVGITLCTGIPKIGDEGNLGDDDDGEGQNDNDDSRNGDGDHEIDILTSSFQSGMSFPDNNRDSEKDVGKRVIDPEVTTDNVPTTAGGSAQPNSPLKASPSSTKISKTMQGLQEIPGPPPPSFSSTKVPSPEAQSLPSPSSSSSIESGGEGYMVIDEDLNYSDVFNRSTKLEENDPEIVPDGEEKEKTPTPKEAPSSPVKRTPPPSAPHVTLDLVSAASPSAASPAPSPIYDFKLKKKLKKRKALTLGGRQATGSKTATETWNFKSSFARDDAVHRREQQRQPYRLVLGNLSKLPEENDNVIAYYTEEAVSAGSGPVASSHLLKKINSLRSLGQLTAQRKRMSMSVRMMGGPYEDDEGRMKRSKKADDDEMIDVFGVSVSRALFRHYMSTPFVKDAKRSWLDNVEDYKLLCEVVAGTSTIKQLIEEHGGKMNLYESWTLIFRVHGIERSVPSLRNAYRDLGKKTDQEIVDFGVDKKLVDAFRAYADAKKELAIETDVAAKSN